MSLTNNDGKPTGPETSQKIYVALRCGRLANRMVLFANLIAFAEEHGSRLVNFTFHSYAEHFEATRQDFYCQFPVVQATSFWDSIPPLGRLLRRLRLPYQLVRYASRLNERFTPFGDRVVTLREIPGQKVTRLDDPKTAARLLAARTIFVYGWGFRAPDLVRRHAEKIRAYFQPVGPIATASREAVARMRQRAEIVVGVHIRHGDYRAWKGGRYFYTAPQYAEWMRAMAALFPGRTMAFLVASDERWRAEEFPGLTVGFCPGSPVADLFALAGCDYIFGPPSTYSQWASFFGNKPLLHLESRDMRIETSRFAVSFLDEIP